MSISIKRGKKMNKNDNIVVFSISSQDNNLSESAKTHLTRVLEADLKALGVEYFKGTAGESDNWSDDVYFTAQPNADIVCNLMEQFKQPFYCLSEPTEDKSIRFITKIGTKDNKTLDTEQVIRVRKDDIKNCDSWFYEPNAKQYWAVMEDVPAEEPLTDDDKKELAEANSQAAVEHNRTGFAA